MESIADIQFASGNLLPHEALIGGIYFRTIFTEISSDKFSDEDCRLTRFCHKQYMTDGAHLFFIDIQPLWWSKLFIKFILPIGGHYEKGIIVFNDFGCGNGSSTILSIGCRRGNFPGW